MGLHKTSMVHGIGAYLEQRGLIGWASEKVASDVYEHIAGQLQGPEELPAAGLDPSSAVKIANMIQRTHSDLVPQGFGGDRSLAMQKQAAAQDNVENLAIMTAGSLMQKRADSMIMGGGEHTNRPGESPDTLARLDQMQRPQGQYLVGVGHSDFPDGPASWSSQPHPVGHGNTVPVSNSISKSASAWDQAGAAIRSAPGDVADAFRGMPHPAQWGAIGAGGGAALGAAGGALAADQGEGGQGALIGAGVGALGGAGLGAGASMAAPFAQDAYGILRSHANGLGDEMSEAMRYRRALMGDGNAMSGGAAAGGFNQPKVGSAWDSAGAALRAAPGDIAAAFRGMPQPAQWGAIGAGGGAALGAAGGRYRRR